MSELEVRQTAMSHEGRYFLLGIDYSKGIQINLLDPETKKVVVVSDESGHRPYCLIKSPLWKVGKAVEELKVLELPKGCRLAAERRIDPMTGEEVEGVKVTAGNPYLIYGSKNSLKYRVSNQILEGFGTSFEEALEKKGVEGVMVF